MESAREDVDPHARAEGRAGGFAHLRHAHRQRVAERAQGAAQEPRGAQDHELVPQANRQGPRSALRGPRCGEEEAEDRASGASREGDAQEGRGEEGEEEVGRTLRLRLDRNTRRN